LPVFIKSEDSGWRSLEGCRTLYNFVTRTTPENRFSALDFFTDVTRLSY
jgi:hypothetical protein